MQIFPPVVTNRGRVWDRQHRCLRSFGIPFVYHELILGSLLRDVLAREENHSGPVHRYAFELALLAELRIDRRVRDGVTVPALAKSIDRTVADEQEYFAAAECDPFEISAQPSFSEAELLGHHAAARVDDGQYRVLVVMREQVAVGGKREPGYLEQLGRKHPAREWPGVR